MKKLLILLTLLLCPLCAAAELPLVYPAETVLSVVPLTQAQRELVERLYSPLLAGEKKISLPAGTRYDDVAPAMTALMLDYPEMFHLMHSYTVSYYQNAPDVAVGVNPGYRMEAKEAQRMRQEMYERAMELLRICGTAEALHDALLDCVAYGGDTELRHTAAGALATGMATCEGYAQALSLLYRMAGIPCGVITGESVSMQSGEGQVEKHAWNIAWLEGYTLIDPTWNDQGNMGLNTHWYFGLSTEQMAVDHTPDADLQVPACGDQANWHRRHGQLAANLQQARSAVTRLVLEGEAVNLRIPDAALYRQIAGDVSGFLDDYNRLCEPGAQFYGSFNYIVSDAQRCIIINRVP